VDPDSYLLSEPMLQYPALVSISQPSDIRTYVTRLYPSPSKIKSVSNKSSPIVVNVPVHTT
jgi:hypothetical protein